MSTYSPITNLTQLQAAALDQEDPRLDFKAAFGARGAATIEISKDDLTLVGFGELTLITPLTAKAGSRNVST